MTEVNKMDSNITGLAYAEETTLGTLGGSPVWKRLEPNSYSDFGGNIKTVAPNPLNPNRQRRKGVAVDIDASGGFNHNLTFYNLTDILQGAMFANTRKKKEQVSGAVATLDDSYALTGTTLVAGDLVFGVGFVNFQNNGLKLVSTVATNKITVSTNLVDEASPPATALVQLVGFQSASGDLDIVNSGTSFPVMTSTLVDFTTWGLVPGQWIYIGGDSSPMQFTTAANNGFKRIRSIATNTMTFDKSGAAMVTEANTTKTVQVFFGDVLKNETGTDIVRRSYQLERTLGAPDTASPSQIQSEVLIGAVANEVTLTVPQAELIHMDISFMAIDNVQRTGVIGPLQASVINPYSADVFNSTSDVSRIRMSVVSNTDAYPTALFAFLTEATFTLKNNVSVDKAIGVFGGFDMTTGTFEVGGSVTAYFASVEAVQAVRNNENVTIDMMMVKNNQGIVVDLPLVALGDGRLKVEQDKPITLPMKMDAATAVDLDANLDYTVMLTIFNYLPSIAG